MIREVGQLLEDRRAAEMVVRTFEEFELALDSRKAGKTPVNVVHLEWLDPVMGSGHWNPELIRMVGGQEDMIIDVALDLSKHREGKAAAV